MNNLHRANDNNKFQVTHYADDTFLFSSHTNFSQKLPGSEILKNCVTTLIQIAMISRNKIRQQINFKEDIKRIHYLEWPAASNP